MQRERADSSSNGNMSCDAVVKILTLYTFLKVSNWHPQFWLVLQNKHETCLSSVYTLVQTLCYGKCLKVHIKTELDKTTACYSMCNLVLTKHSFQRLLQRKQLPCKKKD